MFFQLCTFELGSALISGYCSSSVLYFRWKLSSRDLEMFTDEWISSVLLLLLSSFNRTEIISLFTLIETFHKSSILSTTYSVPEKSEASPTVFLPISQICFRFYYVLLLHNPFTSTFHKCNKVNLARVKRFFIVQLYIKCLVLQWSVHMFW